ncbi:ERC protein 2-like isoform X12 [Acipenser ruthenus]|uniref:ERC protein 2-like isoform X12 n=1 Tax=Acipenser ruthenus TaxID=7906 RepID=UPI002742600A|nr:ERC protein 2-like isoform X12 [Acipenser ruthenus]
MYGSARTVGHLEGSPSRSPRLPRSPRLGHRRTNSGGGGGAGGAGKTLSMENIQSLNAAYATSGPMYLSDHEGVATTTFPKGTMTLGRATSRATYGGRVTAMGSSPNIASAGLPHADILSYGDHGTLTSAGLHHQVPSSLRQVRDNTMLDMHSQLKDLHRENELLRKELDLKDGKLGSSMNSIKTFWSPELKKERVLRKEEAARMSVLKEQMRVSHEENQELHRRTTVQQEPAKMKALQTVIEMKDTKIASLERNLRDLEDEIQMLKTNGLLNTEDREEEMKQMEVYKNHSKFMKNKIDQLKQELSKKESELLALQTKLETLTNQNSDCKQHIEVLKESLTAKEQRSAILQTEVDALRMRLEEKESFLNKKTKQLQDLTEEKCTLAGEIRDMKDMLEVKERKINVLQKKIENLQEQLRDKDKQLTNLKDRVKSLQTDSSNTDTALATLEEALSEKERIIERLKEQRERDDRERLEETESYKKENKDLKEKVNALQAELTEKEAGLIDLKEHASSLASSGLKKDSKLKSLEIAIEQKKEECSKLETQLKKQAEQLFNQMYKPMPIRNDGKSAAHEAEEVARINPEFAEKVKHLEKEMAYYKEESGKSQAEVERLLEILKEVESEKSDKDKKIAELERQVKDQNKKVANLKHSQQVEKKKNAQLLDDARKREDSLTDNSQQLQDSMRERSDRVEELEKALRESVHITAERELVLAQEEAARSAAEKQLEELMMTLEKTRQELDSTKMRLSSTQQSLSEKDGHLTNLRLERRKQLEEILEMKQEALLAAISEKDANIALLELSSSKKKKTQEEVMALKREKDRLVHQLKQQTQNRMKLMADSYDDDHHHHHPPQQHPQHHTQQHQHPQQHHPHPHPHPQHHPQHRSPARPLHANHRPSPDQMIQSLLEKHSHGMKLKLYIDHLTTLCLERDPQFLEGLPPLPAAEKEDAERLWEERARSLTTEQLTEDLEKEEKENAALQDCTDSLLQRIADVYPDILEQVIKTLEEEC